MNQAATESVHVIISGRVQGVGYRVWTRSQARQKGLKGWVRNRADGTVEAVFAGDSAQIKAMLEACYDGPLASRVKTITSQPWQGEIPSDFEQRPTAD
jgi:acylphosphatase